MSKKIEQPTTPIELDKALGEWIEKSRRKDAARRIIQPDGSLCDEFLMLLDLIWEFFRQAEFHDKSTTERLLRDARDLCYRQRMAEFMRNPKEGK